MALSLGAKALQSAKSAGSAFTLKDLQNIQKWLTPEAQKRILGQVVKTGKSPNTVRALRTFGNSGFKMYAAAPTINQKDLNKASLKAIEKYGTKKDVAKTKARMDKESAKRSKRKKRIVSTIKGAFKAKRAK